MKAESPRSTENRVQSKKQSFSGTSTSTTTEQTEHEEPLSAAFAHVLSMDSVPETSQTSIRVSDNGEKPTLTSVSSLSDAASTGTLRRSATDVHEVSEGTASFPTGAIYACDSDQASKEGYVDDLYRTSTSQFERSMMKMPVRGRLVMPGHFSSSKGKHSSQESDNSLVLQKIKEYAERSSSFSTRGEVVRIGDAEIPRRKVTAVGDVDGNKVTDYIVSNVAAKNYSGTVRLYLMGEGDSFLYTRDLIPGNWDFEHPKLNAGDRFGAAVFRLPNTGNSSQCFISITAPGDRSTKDKSGSVHILELTEKGNVNNHTKLSATEFVKLVEEQKKEEQTRGIPSDNPLQGAGPQTSGLQHLGGVTSMLFLNATGGVQAVLNVKATKHKSILQQIETHLEDEKGSKRTLDFGMDHFSSRIAQDDSCLFSRTKCACKLEASVGRNDECFEVFQSKEKHEKIICLKKSCPPAYRCSCEGKEKCRRVEEMEEVYIPDGRGDRGELYCTSEKRLLSKTIPLIET